MLVIGHRGAAAVEAENTLAGIRRALADGADAVEVDVRMTADGHLILLHDETLGRTAPGLAAATAATPVSALSLERVAGAVPTLADAWAAAGGRMVLEIKGAWGSGAASATAAAVAGFLAGRDATGAVVSSFDLLALRSFRAAGGTAATGVLTVGAVDPASNIQAAVDEGHEWCFLPGEAITAEVIRAARDAGKRAVAWTVNDPAAIRALAGAGAHGVITDDPAAAIAALGQTG